MLETSAYQNTTLSNSKRFNVFLIVQNIQQLDFLSHT